MTTSINEQNPIEELVALAQRAADKLQAQIDADMDRHGVLCRFITDMGGRPERQVVIDGVELGAFDVAPLLPGAEPRTRLNNLPSIGAPADWPWGYLLCGCSNDGYG